LQYLGEEGDSCLLDGAVMVSNPWNLEVSSVALQSSFLGLNVYSTVMGTSMKELFERYDRLHCSNLRQMLKENRHSKEILAENPDIDAEKIRNAKYLHEFDRYIQRFDVL